MTLKVNSQLAMRNWVMEVVEEIIPEIKKLDIFRSEPRYISVKDVTLDYQQIDEVHQIDTVVHYLSNEGDFEVDMIIRYFDSEYYATLESTQYEKLLGRTQLVNHIRPVELIKYFPSRQAIVYLSPEGVELEDLALNVELQQFQLGLLIGIVQGGETANLNLKNYINRAAYLLKTLDLDPNIRKEFWQEISRALKMLEECYAGYEPVCQISTDLFRFRPLVDKVTKINIMQGEALKVEILPSFINQFQLDRMENIAEIISDHAFHSFIESDGESVIYDRLFPLMEGYEGFYNNYSMAPLDTIYPDGISLDLHILLNIWDTFTMEESQTHNIEDIIKFSRYVFEIHPYQL